MSAPIQMTAQTLNALKGWPQLNAVDFVAPLDATITERIPPGSVVHLSSTLTFLPGVGNSVVMPMFTFFASDAQEVANPGGDPTADKEVWIPGTPSGGMLALVAIGSYELVSTNYNTAVAGSLVPNALLTSPTTTGGGVNRGQLTTATIKTDTVVGVVSRGIVDNGYGYNAVAFWPWFFPHIT